jgi:vacuolar protein sorting-associated protein VTA1
VFLPSFPKNLFFFFFFFGVSLIFSFVIALLPTVGQHEEKVRYSKWRAADINRALREGRQPTPAPGSGGGEPAESATTTTEPSSSASALPVSPPAALTEAPDAHVGHEQEEAYSTPVLPAVSAAFGEGDPETSSPFEIPRSSAPAPIDASDHPQAQPLILTGSPEPPPPPTLPQRPPAVDMEQGRGRSPSIGAAPLTPSPTTRPQRSISPTHFIIQDSPPPPPPASFNIADTYPSAPPLPPLPPSAPYVQIPVPSAPPLIETSPPAELTPGQIAKTQKHCRFAISALDYEDAEQAKKELRAALAILGG